jgi:hypothetical protein
LPLRVLQLLDLPLDRPFSFHQNKMPLSQTTGPQPLLKLEFLSCGDSVRNAVRRQFQFDNRLDLSRFNELSPKAFDMAEPGDLDFMCEPDNEAGR